MAIKYFTDANSAAGYVNLQKENLSGIQTIYHLLGPDDLVIHQLLSALLKNSKPLKLQPELIYSTFNHTHLSGIIFRELSMAFLSGKVVTVASKVINVNDVFDASSLSLHASETERLLLNMNQHYKKMYMHLNAALLIHDEWEKIYIDRMDFELADSFRQSLVATIFDTDIPAKSSDSTVVRRFFATSTPNGLKDFIPELTAGLTRYLIKGRPGSGKSTLMKEVIKKATSLRYDVDIYHCSLDPLSIDMVIISELDFCIFDATAPHEYDAVYKKDTIIDTYAAFIKPDTDERCKDVVLSIEEKYKNQIKLALAAMANGHDLRSKLQRIYSSALNKSKFDKLVLELMSFLAIE